ncbi:MAG: hypothetical protein A2086_06550 [Spirochaetes bacterium GWD1_27_9]|nr:MAG: hypothetical protein A2086_06550 [Spirochaetes bacterium GWD1_27_9]
MYSTLPLFKSHFSLGKSILTLEAPTCKESYPVSIFDLLVANKLKILPLVDDNISGLLQASKNAKENKIKLMFGLRLFFTEDCLNQNEDSLKKRARYIIFAKNPNGYKDLLRLWSFAAKDGFYYTPCLDFKQLKKLWTDNLSLVVPFYDSFLYLNTFYSHQHVPDFSFTSPVFLQEDNNLPFDSLLLNRVIDFTTSKKFPIMPAQSIYYKNEDDFLAYITFRCIHNRGHSSKSTVERPELDHMGSNTFNFKRWLKNNQTA